ncbi:hypothetical protein B0T18DRAFT_387112 [Schizothecium vesticola]|uniref:Uncharacterized protein n=1 Tax=Schizothecium vesticola TaxID=314040 RepID=A0AA40F480_9PEZI|nr:hypothetical protein B0T18DRAFT_387112 [Schizothecium vesticola]
MGRRSGSERPTIRILILGAPGVGKDCLESRFTTMQYPPQYDTNLVNSRRFLHLSPRRPTALPQSPSPPAATHRPRPSSTSSTFSNPGSLPTTPIIPQTQTQTQTQGHQHQPKLTLNTTALPSPNNPNNDWFHPPTPSLTPTTANPSDTDDNNTYLVEIQNYPLLHHRAARAALLARARFDAVLLVYDVCSRASFDAAARLYDEVPLRRGGGGGGGMTPRRYHAGGEMRSPGAGGGGISPVSPVGGGMVSGGDGVGETVIALVGNKADVDGEGGGGGQSDGGLFGGHEVLSVEEAERERREVEARGLVHPLFRGRFGPTAAGDQSPVKKSAPRPVLDLHVNVSNLEERPLPPTPPEPTSAIEKWIAVDPEVDTDDEQTRVGSRDSLKTVATAAPARREVSRFEGELLARSLLLNVPFFETSAKTGKSVDDMFEAVVREALWQMGHRVEEERGTAGGEGVALGKKGSVLKKGRGGEARKSFVDEAVLSSPISALPPVLMLPDFGRDGFNGTKGPDMMLREMVTVENPVPAAAPPVLKRRRDSVLGGFFKKIFRRSAVTG